VNESRRAENRAQGLVLAMHVALAAFVAFHARPATQDGPAHLYAVHILASLANDAGSIYRPYFSDNLQPVGNSLFTYLALGIGRVAPLDWVPGFVLFLSLTGLPLSALALGRALRMQASPASDRLPEVAATSLSTFLSYNYFAYRGLFNYTLGVPLAIGSLAALLALGAQGLDRRRALALMLLAPALAVLAALAHPAAMVFLLAASAAACIPSGTRRRAIGAVTVTLLLAQSALGHLRDAGGSPTRWMGLGDALLALVRSAGVTQTWLEVPVAIALWAFAGWGAWRGLRAPKRWFDEFSSSWPALAAVFLLLAYFAIPFEYGGAAGLNERVTLFALVLLLPYVPLRRWLSRALPLGFAAFALYTVVERIKLDGEVERLASQAQLELLPPGSVVYNVTLRIKLGAVSADLGRHLLADVARRGSLISGNVFCSHPAHVLRCPSAPGAGETNAVQSFEHLSAERQRQALLDESSDIRRSFGAMQRDAKAFRYWLVLGQAPLADAFQRYVAEPLGAKLLSRPDNPMRIYALPGAGG
jgi:hypothetical protein